MGEPQRQALPDNPFALRERLDEIDKRLDGIDRRLDNLEAAAKAQAQRHDAYRHRFDAIDQALREINNKLQ